jgi:hypothetical protein
VADFRLNDPNKTNSPNPNGYAQIQTQFMYAELYAERRGSSVITRNPTNSNSSVQSTIGTQISLMGYDMNTKQYTTKIGSTDSTLVEYEGFGITSIKVITNSSFVPKVSIEFVDIKGSTVYNKLGNSPYSVLMSFPPPLFTLRLKGYYGKVVEYKLHLVKQNTKLDSATGNYFISVDFVGQSYAPLSDVLLKYVSLAPFFEGENGTINDSNKINLSDFVAPKNTFELIAKTRKLYNQISEFKNNSKDIEKISLIDQNLTIISSIVDEINNYKSFDDFINIVNDLFLGIKKNDGFSDANPLAVYQESQRFTRFDDGVDKIREIGKINEYDNTIRLQVPDKENVYIFLKKSGDDNFNKRNEGYLNNFINRLLESIKNIDDINITSGDFRIVSDIIEYNTDGTQKSYIAIDLTRFYTKLFRYREKIKENKKQVSDVVIEQINQLTLQNLGMIPTIYNVFEILCRDIDLFFNILRDTSIAAEQHHDKYYNLIISRFQKTLRDNIKRVYPFPTYIEANERRYIGDEFDFLGEQFPEVSLVERFIKGFFNQRFIEETLLNDEDEFGNKRFIPINPVETNINQTTVSMPYSSLFNEKEILNKAVERFMVASQYTYNGLFTNSGIFDFFKQVDKKELIKFVANAEARNLVNGVVDLKLIQRLHILVKEYSLDPNLTSFYINNEYYNLDTVPQTITFGTKTITPDRTSSDYIGFEYVLDTTVQERTSSEDIVDEFLDENSNFLKRAFRIDIDTFTKENLILFKDIELNNDYRSRFIPILKQSEQSLLFLYSQLLSTDRNDTILLDKLNSTTIPLNVKVFAIFSTLGNTTSLFRINSGVLKNSLVAGVYELPIFQLCYMGGLVNFYQDSSVNTDVDNFFNGFDSGIDNINDDDILWIKRLSTTDKQNLLSIFEQIVNDKGQQIVNTFLNILNTVKDLGLTNKAKNLKYRELLGQNTENGLGLLSKRNYLINYSTITFFTDVEDFQFIPIKSGDTKINNSYFKQFFQSLTKLLNDRINDVQTKKNDFERSIKDNDIKSQIYYSFKSLNDRWLAGSNTAKGSGFPFNNGGELIDSFRFIDRSGGDIGGKSDLTTGLNTGCVIDISPLIDLSEDLDVSMFTVFSKLLAHNGFEFFPMTNYISFDEDSEEYQDGLFKIYESVDRISKPAFVCMYMGVTSSHLDDGSSEYKNDGFSFSNVDGSFPADMNKNTVNAFIVSYGTQNQSIFNQIELNTNEHKETNESLKILSSLASDRSSSVPVAKNQNLYNTYEQRSYTCTVTIHGGNLMIQPTQYFELQNTPMFNGAYIILGVEHDVVPNKVTTKFTGVRLANYRTPIIKDFATTVGLQGYVDASSSGSGNSNPIDLDIFNITNIQQSLKINEPRR